MIWEVKHIDKVLAFFHPKFFYETTANKQTQMTPEINNTHWIVNTHHQYTHLYCVLIGAFSGL